MTADPATEGDWDSFVEGLLDETRDEISRADTKASILLAGAGVAAAALGGAFISADLTLTGKRGVVQILSAGAAGLLLGGILLLGAAVFPRVGKPEPGRARYFMDHAQHRSVADLRQAVKREGAVAADRHLRQLHDLSRITLRKYRFTQWGEGATGLGLLVVAAAVVAHLITSA